MNMNIFNAPVGYNPNSERLSFNTDPSSPLNYQPGQQEEETDKSRSIDWAQGLSGVFKSVQGALATMQRPQVRDAVAQAPGISPGSFNPSQFAAYGAQAPQPLQNYAALYRRI